MNATKYSLENCPDDLLIIEGVRRGILAANDDWNPTPEEIRSHDTDPTIFMGGNPPRPTLKAELVRRGLNKATGTAWKV